jgi:hypothetical protein
VSVLERTKFSLDVVPSDETGISTRRFYWRLTATNQPALMSSDNYATKREAMHHGEIALERARHRGGCTLDRCKCRERSPMKVEILHSRGCRSPACGLTLSSQPCRSARLRLSQRFIRK